MSVFWIQSVYWISCIEIQDFYMDPYRNPGFIYRSMMKSRISVWIHVVSKLYFNVYLYLYLGYNLYIGFLVFWWIENLYQNCISICICILDTICILDFLFSGYNLTYKKSVSKLYFNLYLYLRYNLYIGFLVFWIQFEG